MSRERVTSDVQREPRGAVAVETYNDHPRAHDGGVALWIPDTNRVIALGAERVSRIKHDPNSQAAYQFLKSRLEQSGYTFGSEKDKFSTEFDPTQEIHHHLRHAAAAYYPSGFPDAGVLVVDDRGYYKDADTYNSTTIWHGQGTNLKPVEMNPELNFPTQSLGHFYSGVTDYLGFGFLEAGKTMGLAAYGKQSSLSEWLEGFVKIHSDGSYAIDPRFSLALRNLYRGNTPHIPEESDQVIIDFMQDIYRVLGPKKIKGDVLTADDMDLLWGAQNILEKVMLGLAKRTKDLTGSNNLCLAGGVALNSVANGKIVKSGLFNNVFIQPAAGDDGQALGKLYYRLVSEYGTTDLPPMEHAYLGPEYTQDEIQSAIEQHADGIIVETLTQTKLLEKTAQALSEQKIGGWFQGSSEVGPRALGHRSILADPRPSWMRDHINFSVKNREWFRPLAPSVLWEKAHQYFDIIHPSAYMLVVSDVLPDMRDAIPAVTHVDGTARVQTVTQEANGIYYDLIKNFGDLTGTYVLLNTSFNVAAEPIVETPDDALRTLQNTKLDFLVMGDHYIVKKNKS